MGLSFLSTEESRIRAHYQETLVDIQEQALSGLPLDETLNQWCATITKLSGISGALITVLDGPEEVLTHGSYSLPLVAGEKPFEQLQRLRTIARELKPSTWQSTPSLTEYNSYAQVHLLQHSNQPVGFLILRTEKKKRTSEAIRALDKLLPHLSNQIVSSLLRHENRLRKAVQTLTTTHLTRENLNPEDIVREIQQILDAESATLLVKEGKKLYLSASTDEILNEARVQYIPGQGFSGHVLKTGERVRLFNATDPEEIEAKTGLTNRPQRKTAEAVALLGDPFHLLAVPIWSSDPSTPPKEETGHSGPTAHRNGVLRITRTRRPFTEFEEQVLHQLGVILGTALARAWKIYLGDRLWHAGSEGVAVTLHTPSTDPSQHGIPILVDFDAAAAEIFGGEPETLRGLDVRELYPIKDYEKVADALSQAMSQGEKSTGPISLTLNKLDGSVCSVDASYRLLTNPFVSPKKFHTASLLRDTTEREKALTQHHRLLKLLAEKGLAYFLADDNGKTLETSPAEQQVTGYSEEELMAMNRSDLYHVPQSRKTLLEKARQAKGKITYAAQELRRKDGSSFIAAGFIRELRGGAGKPEGYEGLYEDCTGKIKLQELLDLETGRVIEDHKLYEALKESTSLNLDYMTSLSHQIRTPLSALTRNLMNFKEFIPHDNPFNKQLEYILGQMKVCNMLTQNLSYIDRILKGEDFKHQRVNLTEMVIQTKLDFIESVQDRRLRIQIDADSIDKIFPHFRGSPELFRQVIVNLLDNAIKYSGDGTKIQIQATSGMHEKILAVSNIGVPIPHHEQRKVFDRGFRNRKAAAYKDGTGIGMWIAKKILTLHRGKISCTSIPSKTHHPLQIITFRLSFPENGTSI